MITTDGSIGVLTTGRLNQKLLNDLLRVLPKGTWELVCHPGYHDAELAHSGTRLLRSRPAELQVLTSQETKHVLQECDIEPISYADLKQS